ncbi:ATP-dependent DNA ligase [Phytohabitans flavus]|uniref:ATP-dependent DNA ligase n=1 Tax=Phytohabitans flavus TaxID=1076124 RepID=A0A6F8XL10_9ACTN|nr:ATP-dependent DNA ligase [Phytohabitans flavus]BCB74500.1 ATP-dependent DNA ligase [Phytohabitans flavus]
MAPRRVRDAPEGLRPPVEPMHAAPVDELPAARGWAYEPKWDGWRALAFCFHDRVYLQSRSGRALSSYFPEITRLVREHVPEGTVLDGELIVWEADRGRTSFAALQRRVTAGPSVVRMARESPAHFVVFDVLAEAGTVLLAQPLGERRARLEVLLADAPATLQLCPQTTDLNVADEWMQSWPAAGVEGIVAKRLDGRYQPGRRTWRKWRARSTTEAIVGGVTGSVSDPATLLLGRYDTNGRLRYVGRSHQLVVVRRRELAPLLARSPQRRRGGIDHPWPQPLPASWSGQWDRPEPLPYVQVEPTVVVEIAVNGAFEHGRWRHPVHVVRPRLDMSVFDVPLGTRDEP